MIGTRVQPRRPRITSTPSMPGRPRSRMTRSGCLLRGDRRAPPRRSGRGRRRSRARGGWCASARRICGSSSTTRMRRHVGGPQPQRRSVSPPPGRVVGLDLAAHGLDEALRDGEAEPDALAAGRESPSRWNGWKSRSRSARGTPGPAVDDAHVDAAVDRARGHARAASPAARTRTAFEITLASARSSRPRSASTRGSVSGTSSSTAPSAARRGCASAAGERPRRARPARR